jgi:AcrR family transcriptional regulator
MSIPYESTGRTRQKARTRADLIDAARALLREGVTPTVEQAADRAASSRTTAFRYFQTQRALLVATYPELDLPSLLDADAPADPAERLELVLDHFTANVLEHEHELRAMLRLSLESPAPRPEALPLRQGRAIGWIEDALSPLADRLGKRGVRRLTLAIRATVGIEAYVWLTDVAGLAPKEAVDVKRSSARALLRCAVEDSAG